MEKQVLFFGICRGLGLMRLGRWLRQQEGRCLIILNYHRASEGDLRSHLLYLRRHYRIMHLEEALEALYAKNIDAKSSHDPRTLLAVTFDDGYKDNYTHAFPLARELQVPITIFLIPGYIGSNRRFWWLEGDQLVRCAQVDKVTIEGRTYRLTEPEHQKELVQAIYTRLYHAKSIDEREAFLEDLREALAVSSEHREDNTCVLTWTEISEMQESGWVSFGAHTMHHPVLAELSDPLEVQHEVSECRTILQKQLGLPVRVIAYPMGKIEHIGEEAVCPVQKASYSWAVTTIPGINTSKSHPLLLRRLEANPHMHWLLLAADTSGIRPIFSPLFPYGRVILSVGDRLKAFFLRHLHINSDEVKKDG